MSQLLICDHATKTRCFGCPCSVPHEPRPHTECPGPSQCLALTQLIYRQVKCVPVKDGKTEVPK